MCALEKPSNHLLEDVEPEKKEAPDAITQVQGLSKMRRLNNTGTNMENQDPQNQRLNQAPPSDDANQLAALEQEQRDYPENPQPWGRPVDIEHVADEMFHLVKRHCVMTDDEATAVVLWLISSYMINKFRIFAKLALISPQKRCGKSTALEIIDALAKEGLTSSSVSPASIYRIAEQLQVTLLFDEADTYIKNGDPQLIGLINSSHSQNTAKVLRCVGDDHKPKSFSTWMPFVLASIGELPSTIMDRSIVINLRRKKPSEPIQSVPAAIFTQCRPLREKILRWCLDSHGQIAAELTTPPNIGNDRAADNWSPLFSVARQVSPTWLKRCEAAYGSLTQAEETDLSTMLLEDIRQIFDSSADARITSKALVDKLLEDESRPWSTCQNGRKLSQSTAATMLRPFGIKPKSIRFSDNILRGYEKDQFTDTFERYLQ